MVNELTNQNKHTTDHEHIFAQICMQLLCLHDINFAFSNNILNFSPASNYLHVRCALFCWKTILHHLNNLSSESRKSDETYG